MMYFSKHRKKYILFNSIWLYICMVVLAYTPFDLHLPLRVFGFTLPNAMVFAVLQGLITGMFASWYYPMVQAIYMIPDSRIRGFKFWKIYTIPLLIAASGLFTGQFIRGRTDFAIILFISLMVSAYVGYYALPPFLRYVYRKYQERS